MEKIYKILFELYRSMRILLEHFGLEDKAAMIQGEFVCIEPSGYPRVYFRGSYQDCLYEVFKRPGSKIIPAAERDIAEQIYRLQRANYDDEYHQMLQENRLIDRELRRRQKVRRKRQRGRPSKKRQVWVYKGERFQGDKMDPKP